MRCPFTWLCILILLTGCGGGGGGGGGQGSSPGSANAQGSAGVSPPTPTPSIPTNDAPIVIDIDGFRLTIPAGTVTNGSALTASTTTSPTNRPVNPNLTFIGKALTLFGPGVTFNTNELTLTLPTSPGATLLADTNTTKESWALSPIQLSRSRDSTSDTLHFIGNVFNLSAGPTTIAGYQYLPKRNDVGLYLITGDSTQPVLGNRYLLLIHGIHDDYRGLLPLANLLAIMTHYDAILIYQYDFTRGADAAAVDLAALLRRVESPLATAPVAIDIVAHSYGGLVARWFAEHAELLGLASCDHIITLSTPHLGTLANANMLTSTALNTISGHGWIWSASDPALQWLSVGSTPLNTLTESLGTVRLSLFAGTRYPRALTDATDLLDLGLLMSGSLLYGNSTNDGIVTETSAQPLITTNGVSAQNISIDRSDCHHVNIVDPTRTASAIAAELMWPFGKAVRRLTSVPFDKSWRGVNGHCLTTPTACSTYGRYVTFESVSNDFGYQLNNIYNIFLADQHSSSYELISVGIDGQPANGVCRFASISGDGRYVAFTSKASNLVPNDTNSAYDIFVRDRTTKTTQRISVSKTGVQGNGDSGLSDTDWVIGLAISADGQTVVYSSLANNLVANDTNAVADVFMWCRATGTTRRINVTATGQQANGYATWPSVSGDGQFVTFESGASNFPGNVFLPRAFCVDIITGAITDISVNPLYQPGNSSTNQPVISANGRYITYSSYSTNIVPNDTNATSDVFRYDRINETTERVSVDSSGNQLAYESEEATISYDGRYVAFSHVTNATLPAIGDILVWDGVTKTTSLASINDSGVAGDGLCNYPAIAGDGRTVMFGSGSSNFAPHYFINGEYSNLYQVGNRCLH